MTGHADPHCFRISKTEDGIVGLWCKDYASVPQDWVGDGGSRRHPFVLVKPNMYPEPTAYAQAIPDCVPKHFAPEEINRLRAGLEACHPRMKILDPSDKHFLSCMQVIDRLELAEPRSFHWDVKYAKEDESPVQMEEDEKEPPQLPSRSFLSSRKRRRGKAEAAVVSRIPEVGDMVVIKADDVNSDANSQRFWIAQLRKVVSRDDDGDAAELEILWFQASKEFGKYTYLMEGKGKNRRKYVQNIESETVFYSFDALDDGYIPDVHAANILTCVERDDF